MSRAAGRRDRPAGAHRPAAPAAALILLLAVLVAGAGPSRAAEPAPLATPAPAVGAARGPGPWWFAFGAGAAEIVDPDTVAFVSFELRQGAPPRRPAPWIAAEATRRDRFLGLGVSADFPLGARLVLTPAFGGMMYLEHDGIGLGSQLEFRSSIEVAARAGRTRVGARLAHYSNAGLGDTNPGTEALTIVWVVPVGGTRSSATVRHAEPAAVLHQDHRPAEHQVGRGREPGGDAAED